MSSQLAIAEYDRSTLDLIKRTFAQGTTDDEFALFIQTCKRVNLDPFARQAFCVKRYDSKLKREVAQTQVSIDGFRVIAERSGAYEGQTPAQWCGADGMWRDVWLSSDEPPSAARVGVYRVGWREPLYAVARWGAYVQMTREGGPNRMWNTMGDVMLAKCAEALALRKAFPQDLSGIYSPDEMGQADNDRIVPHLGEEEKARSARQVEAGARKGSEEITLAKGLWQHACANIGDLASLREWIAGNRDAIASLSVDAQAYALYGKSRKHTKPLLEGGICAHAVRVVEGLNEAGFADEMAPTEQVAEQQGGEA